MKPWGECFQNFTYTSVEWNKVLKATVAAAPSIAAARKGTIEKAKIPSEANLSSRIGAIFSSASPPGGAFNGNANLAKSYPCPHSANIAVMLGHFPDFLDDATGHESEVTSIERQPNRRESSQHPIEKVITSAKPQSLFAIYALHVHHIVPLLIRVHQGGDCFRRILQIPVHKYGYVT